MIDKDVFVIGVMSGTSLDGVDLVYVTFNDDDYTDFKIINAETVSYTTEWKQILQKAVSFNQLDLDALNLDYGKLLAGVINDFIAKYKINTIDFIASHGHTILHQPELGITLQVGDGQTIATITKQKVVCDFRSQDVKLGGQGAPLVPIGDELLFSDYQYCLNLGGFSNISFKKDEERIAFDICPVNIVMNYYVNKLGFEYDESGKIASQGILNQQLLDELNSLEFYEKAPPKSLGLEWVQNHIYPLIEALETDIPSILRTFVEHIAVQIGKEIYQNQSVLITGGGAFNAFLLERLALYSNRKIVLPNNDLINFKEALLFAFLGFLRVKNQINCLKSVTGASKNHSSGLVFYP